MGAHFFLPESFTGMKCAKQCRVLEVSVLSYYAVKSRSGDAGVRRYPSEFFLTPSDKSKTV
jgi:hypothetical protein